MKIELTVEEIKRICVALDCFGDKRAEIQGDAYGIQYWRIRDKLKKYIEVNENKKMTEAEKAALEDWGVSVGQTIYVISDWDCEVLNAHVFEITRHKDEKVFLSKRLYDYIRICVRYRYEGETYGADLHPSDFNKYVFTNQEDAEKMAKNLKEHGYGLRNQFNS